MRARFTRPPRLLAAACRWQSASSRARWPVAAGRPRRADIFYTAEVHGTLEPCGCTSDPLGDVARYAALVRAAAPQRRRSCWSTRAACRSPESARAKEKQANAARATFLADALGHSGAVRGRAGGDRRARAGPCPAERVAANFSRAARTWRRRGSRPSATFASAILASPTRRWPAPSALRRGSGRAAKREAAACAKGAELVIALAPVEKPLARRIARDAAVDLVVLGRQVGTGMARAEQVGRRVPGRGRGRAAARRPHRHRVARTAARSSTPAGPRRRRCAAWRSTTRSARIDEELRRWPAASRRRSGVHRRQTARARRAGRGARRAGQALDGAADRQLLHQPTDPAAPQPRRATRRWPRRCASSTRRSRAINLQTRQAAAAAPSRGAPYYVGDAKCASCHKTAAAFWKKTVHAQAWKTLVDGGKQNDYKCVGCHVTGYGEVGGTSLGHTKKLQRRAVRGLPRPGLDARRRGRARRSRRRCTGRRPPAPAPSATPSSTPTPSSTRPTCATSSAPGHGAERAQEAGRRPDRATSCAARRSRARRSAGQEAEEGRLTSRTRSVGQMVVRCRARRRRRRSAAGRGGRARCCRR